jgi:alpha-glucosidase
VQMAYRLAAACAKHHLMLDYHGFYKPTGMNRTYPNLVNIESVFGMEEAKWSPKDVDMPQYDVTFPYIRMMAGHVDFTPGAMRNATKSDFQPVYSHPFSMGTRCHQAAMYVVFDSPLTMLADAPTEYQKEEAYTRFLCSLPTIYDETRVVQGEMGKYIVTARRHGNTWYVGGMTNWDSRTLDLKLDFLTPGRSYNATICQDGMNADHSATDYLLHTDTFKGGDSQKIYLASGGGFVMVLQPK